MYMMESETETQDARGNYLDESSNSNSGFETQDSGSQLDGQLIETPTPLTPASQCHENRHKQKQCHPKDEVHSVLPPFSGTLTFDNDLILSININGLDLSCKTIECTIREWAEKTERVFEAVYPSPFLFAQFSSLVYLDKAPYETDFDYERRLNLPDDWKLLTIASNADRYNGYFGIAYWKPEQQLVVVAHRGTCVTQFSSLYTDIFGIVFSCHVPRMNSACTFALIIKDVLQKVNNEFPTKANFQLFFTGHSLGGWLAQTTAFCTEYLVRTSPTSKSVSLGESFHAHTVVFDSPGCRAMLTDLQGSFDVKYEGKSINFDTLDITSYLSAPNVVNTCNSHVGTLFRIFIDLSNMNWLQKNIILLYTRETHSMDSILKAFDPNSRQIHKVRIINDWPVSCCLTGEYNKFFRWAIHLNDYHPDPKLEEFQAEICKSEGCYPIRYQTSEFVDDRCRINIFTQPEQDFLTNFTWLRKFPEFCKPHELFSETTNGEVPEKFSRFLIDLNFEIRDQWILCHSAEMVRKLVSMVKSCLKFFPMIIHATGNILSSFQIRNKLYQSATMEYLNRLQKIPFCFKENSVDLTRFLENVDQQAWNIKTKHTLTSVAKLYRTLEARKKLTNYNCNSCTVLEIKTILALSTRLVSLSDYLDSDEITNHLLIIEGIPDPNSDHFTAAQNLLNDVFNIFERKKNLKFILVSTEDDELTKVFQEYKDTQAHSFFITNDTNALWLDLTRESQKALLLKKRIYFQSTVHRTSLGELMGIKHFTENLDVLEKIIDTETALKLGNEEDISIGSASTQFCDLKAAYAKVYEDISEKKLASEILRSCEESTLFLISCVGDTDTDFKSQLIQRLTTSETIAGIKSKVESKLVCLIVDQGTNDKAFKKLCQKNPNKTIYWLKMAPLTFVWLQLYHRNFYCPRQFKHFEKIILSKGIREFLVAKEMPDFFIFSGILENDTLENILEITDIQLPEILNERTIIVKTEAEAKALLSDVLNKSIAITSSEQIAKDIFKKCGKLARPVHWLNVEKGENISNVVWHSSHGSLNTLRKYIDSIKSQTILGEADIIKKENNVFIFADVPGMGKSTSLVSLSRQIVSDWVICINPKDCKRAINTIPPNIISISHVVEFLAASDSIGLNSSLAKALLEYVLVHHEGKTPVNVYILFDGFDELREDCVDTSHEQTTILAEKFTRLFQFLQRKTVAKIWITTRGYRKEYLENSLSVFSTAFTEIDQKTQIEFFKTFWKVRLSLKQIILDENELSKYAKKIVESEIEILKGNATVMGHPLVMRMLAESVQPKPGSYESFIQNDYKAELRTIVGLYESFIEMKYDIYLKEKVGLANNFTNLHRACLTDFLTKKHRHLAFQLLFREEADKYLGKKYEADDCALSDELTECNHAGLIQLTHGGTKFEFIHDSCAEYFTADLLLSWLLKPHGRHPRYPPVEYFLLTQVLVQPEYELVRLFLNGQINKNPTELCKNKIAEHCSTKNYDYKCEKKTALHVLAEENHGEISEFLLGSFQMIPEVLIDLLSIRDDNGDSMLYIAVKDNSTMIVNQVMECIRNCSFPLKHKLLLATIFRKADDENNDAVKKCISFFITTNSEMKNICKTIGTLWNLITAYLNAAKDGNTDGVRKYFIYAHGEFDKYYSALESSYNAQREFVKYYLTATTDSRRKTALHLAAEHGHEEVVDFLLSQNANVEARDKNIEGRDNFTPLHYAVKSYNSKLVSKLINFGAHIDVLDRSGLTPLHHAIKVCSHNCVDLLLKKGADIAIKGKNGMSSLSWAAKSGIPEIFELVKNKISEKDETQLKDYLNEVDKYGMTPFYHAMKNNKWDIAMKLADMGANINIADITGKKPIERAIKARQTYVVERMTVQNAELGLDCYGKPL